MRWTAVILCACVGGPSLPRIDRVTPATAASGATLDVVGAGFGDHGFVTIGAVAAETTAWSDGRIAVTVPDLAPGATTLVVTAGNEPSNEIPVEITK